MKWYYESNGQPKGPILESELRRLRDEGKIAADSLVWSEGMEDWAPLNTIKALSALPGMHTKAPAPLPSLKDATLAPQAINADAKAPAQTEAETDLHVTARECPAKPAEQTAGDEVLESALRQPVPEDARPEWEHFSPERAPAALLISLKEILFEPQSTFRNLAHNGGWGLPLSFLILAELIGNCFIFFTLRQVPANGSPLVATLRGMIKMEAGGAAVFSSIAASTLLLPIAMVVKAMVLHFSLKYLARSEFEFPTTFRCLCYAQGGCSFLWSIPLAAVTLTNAVGDPMAAVPALILSMAAVGAWSVYINLRALASTHQTSFVMTALSVMAPPFIAAFLVALLVGGVLTGAR
jgi:hypothetical protein